MSDPVAPSQPRTLLDVLELRAAQQPDTEAYTFLIDGETREVSFTYAELYRRARASASQLQGMGDAGERALLLCPAGLDYFAAFFGCVCSGLVAVLAYAPHPDQQIERLHNIVRSAKPRVGITTRAALPTVRRAFADVPDLSHLQWLLADEIPSGAASHWRRPDVGPDSLVYLIYTSGSTATPKGVTKANRDLPMGLIDGLYNEPERHHRIVNWAPPHSAAALILPIANCVPATHMSPEAFMERPARWIELMSSTRATYTVAPNFAYDLVVDAIPPAERPTLDLSNWQYAFNVGEQVRAETIERFEAAFAASGLRRGTMQCGYGLSEASGISASEAGKRPTMTAFDRVQLERGRVVPVARGSEQGRVLVGQGKPNSGVSVLIVDPETLTRTWPDQVGEIWTASAQVAAGYWNAPEETQAAFGAHLSDTGEGPYFRTGDLGFLYEGEIFITGRLKEVIIIRGRNVHAVDIELVAQRSHPSLHARAGAAFSVESGTSEQLVIVQEISLQPEPSSSDSESAELREVADAIRRAVLSEIGIQVDAVALVAAGAIPRTDIGKLRRAACRTAYLDGTLPVRMVRASSASPGRGQDNQASERRSPYAPPVSPVERELVTIWESVLGVHPIGIHDEFVDLGGDSLRSLQIQARMRANGLHMNMAHTRTIAALAEVIARQPASDVDEPPVVGPVPMLLMHYGVLGNREELPADLVARAVFTSHERLDPVLLESAARHIVLHHDVLRMRFGFAEEGWHAECIAHPPNPIVSSLDLSAVPVPEHAFRMQTEEARLRRQIDIRQGIMLQIGHVHHGADLPDRIVLLLPHLAFDGLSLPILVADLEAAYLQLRAGRPIQLPAKTTSILRWGERLHELTASELRSEAAYWLEVLRGEPTQLPPDAMQGDSLRGGITDVWTTLDREPLQNLLRLASRYGIRTIDALLHAITGVVAHRTGSTSILMDMFGHGREQLTPDIDVSRTVGYFTTLFPVRFEIDRTLDAIEATLQVRRQLEAVPRHGIGFDALRYLCRDELCDGLRVPHRPIRLNFLGDTSATYGHLTLLQPEEEPSSAGSGEAPTPGIVVFPAPPTDLLDIVGFIEKGELRIRINYHTQVYRRATIEQFAAEMYQQLQCLVQAVTQRVTL